MISNLKSKWRVSFGLAMLPLFAYASLSSAEPPQVTTQSLGEITGLVRRATRRGLRRCGEACSQQIFQAVMRESQRAQFEPILLLSIIATESAFVPNKRGAHGEIGLMQIKPSTARWIAKRDGIAWHGARSLLKPAINIRLGVAYLAFLRETFRSHRQLYLAAYNMGARNVRRALRGRLLPRDYSSRVMIWYGRFQRELV